MNRIYQSDVKVQHIKKFLNEIMKQICLELLEVH